MKSQNNQQKTKSDSVSDDEDPFREITQEKSAKRERKTEKVKIESKTEDAILNKK